MQQYDEIRIRELQIFAHHGVFDFETNTINSVDNAIIIDPNIAHNIIIKLFNFSADITKCANR